MRRRRSRSTVRTLSFTGDEATITLDEIEHADSSARPGSITGTVANEAVTVSPVDSEASMTITDDGTVAVNTGCNTGSGSVEVTDDTLDVRPDRHHQDGLRRRSCTRSRPASWRSSRARSTYEIDGAHVSLRTATAPTRSVSNSPPAEPLAALTCVSEVALSGRLLIAKTTTCVSEVALSGASLIARDNRRADALR